ncbi:L-glutamate gamma-semialdehyde dehydrogenase [bacterium]|nr:L-glutamate gamma-semialdehyde dehydrogenase [bacterium]
MPSEFRNETYTDFTDAENQRAFRDALDSLPLGDEQGLVIAGREVKARRRIESVNPSRPAEIVGRFPVAEAAEARAALDAAWDAFSAWAATPVEIRAQVLFDAAALIRKNKHLYSAAMVVEVGKPWGEADADTAEAIDFLEFYGRQALALQGRTHALTPYPGERPELFYIPLGAGVVIPPWNFPMAIALGMTAAAIVAGNTVVLKPSSDAPFIGRLFFDALVASGMPPGVVNYLPGEGRTAGEELVTNARTRFIAFTGSREVGLGIVEKAGRTAAGQVWIKRVIAEMGGKNGIVVDESADVDSAAAGIVASAFGYAGQKCSACSRAIIHPAVYDRVRDAVAERASALRVGDPRRVDTQMGPVINRNAHAKTMHYIDIGKREAKLLAGGEAIDNDGGYYIAPTVFENVAPGSTLDQEEIFAPVLSIIKTDATAFEDLVALANATEYGLTGAVYSADRKHLNYARDHFHVGNLYFNRKCTGALVDVHPFGGFNMSGTDSKAGGRDYLLLLTQAKSVSEKI